MLEKSPHKERIKIAVYLLSKFIHNIENISRNDAVEMLRKEYERHGLKPIMGKSIPPDIFDKELATVYVIGKYGLSLDKDYPEVFKKLFYIEEALEEALSSFIAGEYEKGRQILKSVSPSNVVDSNTIARMLRIPLVKYVLGFAQEEEVARIFKTLYEALKDEEKTVRNYIRFFIALRIAEGIRRGEVRNKAFKEAFKRAMAIRLGFPKSTPSDKYIAIIAENVYGVPREKLAEILNLESGQEDSPASPS
ncbi:DUF2192 domain-containing protein [Thermogladius sp. 4427co]|uniref:DUF2192 domain-containing protein n=1 Tax=Thermogladius sp. 4427co TaxID=3450718 RepID=UPI003F79BB45